MFDLLNEITEVLRGTLGSPWLWLIVFAVAGLDALLPFMPSETTVVTVAVLLGPDLKRLTLLAVIATAGAWAGDCVSYRIGRRAGPAMLTSLQRRNRERYEWARARVEAHNTLLIIAARYLPGGRVASGLATGSMGVSWPRFALLDLLGSGIWAVYSACVGMIGGASFADEPGKGLLLSFAIGLLMVGVLALLRRLRSRHAARTVRIRDPEPVRRPALRGDRGGA
ncbi:MAG TPA: VTT domain-containing protein [Amycolatopsis sp.]|uniref:DedA family protein n=1 Tax=Amycolatopsis sp. TaxID=37632 RepID=UPI002B49BA6A|nr:VTT domain-containing protein [Amycolatopsis sp.]HKS48399.1 VTT domain-containing protein [Amycolatopsis sp.]